MATGTANGGTYHSTIATGATAETVTMDTTGGDTFLVVNRSTNPLFFTVGDTVNAPVAASAAAKGARVVPANASRIVSGITAAPGAQVKISVVTATTADAYDVEQIS